VAKDICMIVLKVFKCLYDISGVLNSPILIIPILGWVAYAMQRLIAFAIEKGESTLIEDTAAKAISSLKGLKNKTTNQKVKDDIQKKIDSLQEKLDKLEGKN
jgi:hypothetical protein